MLKESQISEIFNIFAKANPDPKSELSYKNDFTFLVAIILSAQSTDKGVNKATPALFAVADTPEKMLKMGIDKLKGYIKTIGLYNNKAKNIIAMSEILINEHNSKVPYDKDALEKLPGIASKTANVFLNERAKAEYIAVDTHVFRLSNLMGIVKTKNPKETEAQLYKRVPQKFHRHTSDWLVLHGRYICVARKPKCSECPINHICESAQINP